MLAYAGIFSIGYDMSAYGGLCWHWLGYARMCYGLQGLTQIQILIQILIQIQILMLSMSTRRHVAPRLCCTSQCCDGADGGDGAVVAQPDRHALRALPRVLAVARVGSAPPCP